MGQAIWAGGVFGRSMMRGGTRMRIVNGRTEWIRDRNGNQVSITYPTSTRMIATDPLGRQFIIDKNVSEAAPYGLCDKITFNGALGYTGGDGVRQQFTSKERDSETGLDYFLARYYSSTQGRFTSPDEFSGGPKELFVLGTGRPTAQTSFITGW